MPEINIKNVMKCNYCPIFPRTYHILTRRFISEYHHYQSCLKDPNLKMPVCHEATKNNTICHKTFKTFKTDKNTLNNEFLNEKTLFLEPLIAQVAFQLFLICCIGSMALSTCKIRVAR